MEAARAHAAFSSPEAEMKHGAFLLWICSIFAAVGWTQDFSGKDDSRAGIPFEIQQPFGLILIRAQVNGHPATLVVDTGSSRTIVSPELAEVRPFSLELARPAEKGSGFVGIAGWGKATAELRSLKWNDQRVLVMTSLRDLSKSVGKRVDGIIGEDILSNVGSLVIDFRHHRLVLR